MAAGGCIPADCWDFLVSLGELNLGGLSATGEEEVEKAGDDEV
jgi:hypothetical protein